MPNYPNIPRMGLNISGGPDPGGSTVASMAPGPTQSGAGPYGTVPTAPDPGATQAAALQYNLSQMARIQAIMAAINEQNVRSQRAALEYQIPGYLGEMGQAMGNIGQGQRGFVPGDVWNMIQTGGAERGIGVGSPVSPNSNAAMLAVLGKTSLGEEQRAMENFRNIIAAVPQLQPWNPSSLLITPEQVFNAQYLANVLRAAPNPTEAAMAELGAVQAGAQSLRGQPYLGPMATIPAPAQPSTRTPAPTPNQGWYYADQPTEPGTPYTPRQWVTPTPKQQPVIDSNGDEWVNMSGNEWTNLSTGAISFGMPSANVGWTYEQPGRKTSLTWTPDDFYGDLFGDLGTSPEGEISDLEAYWGAPASELDYWAGGA